MAEYIWTFFTNEMSDLFHNEIYCLNSGAYEFHDGPKTVIIFIRG
ncbi:hypothetical protein ABMA70_10845 [Halobacteriovorax sp. XZX-3]|nr:hypothetical protein [Halobacteriovorax sp. DA5]